MPKCSFLWITDPWDTLDHDQDTTLRLAEEAQTLGYASHWCDLKSIRWEDGRVLLDTCKLSGRLPMAARVTEPREFTSLHYRTDPPVDLAYLHPLQLLVLGLRGARRSQIVNPPSVLFMANEKTEAALLGRLMPPSCVATRWEDLERFGRREGKTVLKPLHRAQSQGVELLDWTLPVAHATVHAVVEKATEGFRQPVLLQRYLAGISEGEQRLWFLDGKLLACARKLPLPGDFRVNIDGGSELRKTRLSAAEKRAALEIGKLLRKQGIRLAAVDLIEGYVTDFNFTSPGLLRQMEKILGENLARPIIRALAR